MRETWFKTFFKTCIVVVSTLNTNKNWIFNSCKTTLCVYYRIALTQALVVFKGILHQKLKFHQLTAMWIQALVTLSDPHSHSDVLNHCSLRGRSHVHIRAHNISKNATQLPMFAGSRKMPFSRPQREKDEELLCYSKCDST